MAEIQCSETVRASRGPRLRRRQHRVLEWPEKVAVWFVASAWRHNLNSSGSQSESCSPNPSGLQAQVLLRWLESSTSLFL